METQLLLPDLLGHTQKLPENEEISSCRWSQYILKFSRSHSEESYDPNSALQKIVNSCKFLQILVTNCKNFLQIVRISCENCKHLGK